MPQKPTVSGDMSSLPKTQSLNREKEVEIAKHAETPGLGRKDEA